MVYFIQEGSRGNIKIGWANCVDSRMRGFQTGNSAQLYLRAIIPGGLREEAALHQRFSPYRIRNQGAGREWFKPEPVVEWLRSIGQYGPTRGLMVERIIELPHAPIERQDKLNAAIYRKPGARL